MEFTDIFLLQTAADASIPEVKAATMGEISRGSFTQAKSLLLVLSLLFQLGGCSIFYAPQKKPLPPEGSACSLVRTAYTQIGNNYAAGCASPRKGFDCSGLVWWAYRQHGYKIPRTTTEQARAGKPIHKSKLKAGDILVFKTGDSPRGLHTGLYAGSDQFIHSPSSGKNIRLDSIRSRYWSQNLVAARRILR